MSNATYEWGHRRLNALSGNPTRNIRRLMFQPTALPNNSTVNTAHGLTAADLAKIVHVSGRAYDSTGGNTIPLPYAHGTDQVTCDVNATNIRLVTVVADMSDFDDVVVYIDLIDD